MYYNLFQLVFSYCQADLFKDIPSNLYLKCVNTGCVPGCMSYLWYFSFFLFLKKKMLLSFIYVERHLHHKVVSWIF